MAGWTRFWGFSFKTLPLPLPLPSPLPFALPLLLPFPLPLPLPLLLLFPLPWPGNPGILTYLPDELLATHGIINEARPEDELEEPPAAFARICFKNALNLSTSAFICFKMRTNASFHHSFTSKFLQSLEFSIHWLQIAYKGSTPTIFL